MEDVIMKLFKTIYKMLTSTERTIIEMRIAGYSRKEIASQLFRSEKTIKTHFQNILKKLQFKDELQVITWYLITERKLALA